MSNPGGPLFSILVPAFNAERTVRAAVESALGQTLADLEVVVIDDGSTDHTGEVVSSIEDSRLTLVRQENAGLAGARNAGIGVARGRYVSLLDADDLLLPEYLAHMRAALESRPQAGFAYCDAWEFEDGTGRIRREPWLRRQRPRGDLPFSDPDAFFRLHLRHNFIFGSAAIRRSVLDAVGHFAEHLIAAEDYEMWLRIEAAGYEVVEVGRPLMLYRRWPGQMSNDAVRMATSFLQLCDELERYPRLPPGAAEILVERRRELEEALSILRKPSAGHRARKAARRRVGRALRTLPGLRLWTNELPADVARTFPDLARI